MQKIINVLAVTSFVVSTGVVVGGSYVYLNRDQLIEDAKGQVAEAIAEAIPGIISGLTPDIPSVPSSGGGISLPFKK